MLISKFTLLLSAVYSVYTFIHPGILLNKPQLDFTRAKVKGLSLKPLEPWDKAYKVMIKSKFASLSFVPMPREIVECGSYSNPNHGCTDETDSAIAAYTHALMWYYTGNKAHANKSIEIMDAWAAVIKGHNNSNAPLQTGWAGAAWPRAGEIIRYTCTEWTVDQIKRFSNMLRNVYLPVVRKGATNYAGNWELIMTEATGNIAVFLEDWTAFKRALELWRNRVPAYIYLKYDGPYPKAPVGSIYNTIPKLIDYWYGQTTFVDGLAQETCRDFGHATWGIGAAINFAETAYHQGINLYKESQERIVKSMEFHAKYINDEEKVPSWLCGGIIVNRSSFTWEIGYNHYHNRLHIDMPHTKLLISRRRPMGVDYFLVWETMTHADNPGCDTLDAEIRSNIITKPLQKNKYKKKTFAKIS